MAKKCPTCGRDIPYGHSHCDLCSAQLDERAKLVSAMSQELKDMKTHDSAPTKKTEATTRRYRDDDDAQEEGSGKLPVIIAAVIVIAAVAFGFIYFL